ncbi:MAG: hypothetical protein DSY90_00640 [Deltaproteobacteria bacterium]|nr:MAG: hypothetical protein DSY90_00640 [Deltaproteobacteria bacterium]
MKLFSAIFFINGRLAATFPMGFDRLSQLFAGLTYFIGASPFFRVVVVDTLIKEKRLFFEL